MLTLSYQPISLLLLILLLVPSSWGYDNIYNTISSIGDVPKDNELFFLNRDALLHNSNRVISPRVVGGTEAGGPIEYQVLLLLNYGEDGFGRCGGSLIAPNVVLSAAHCQMGNVNQYFVITGLYEYEDIFEDPLPDPITILTVQDQIIHPNYDAAAIDNDVMLLRLSQSVNNMEPIPLDQNPSTLTVGETVRVSGWGTTSSGGSVSNILLYADLGYVSNSECNIAYNGDIDDFEMCASESGKDSCQGDSGGPLVISEFSNGKPLLVGVVSWGYGCALPQYPGVYARVSYFYNWIINNGCSWHSSLCTSGPVIAPPTPSPITQSPTSKPTDSGPTASPIPTISCNDYPNFLDNKGDDCEWYEINDDPGCPVYGYLGITTYDIYAAASCCYCDGGYSGDGYCDAEEVDEPGWTDVYGDDCYWYASFDYPGCPLFGESPNFVGTTANEACCYCRTSYDECDMEGWTDTDGYDCSWYLNFDSPGCPFYGFLYPNEDGVDANAACCYCKDTDNECDLEGWTDVGGDDCSWYESNDSPGCPSTGSSYPNEDGVDANAACCYCKDTDNENQTSSPSQTIDESSENPTNSPSQVIDESSEYPTNSPSQVILESSENPSSFPSQFIDELSENPTNSPSQVTNKSSENPTILPSSSKETQNPTDEPSKSSAIPSVPLSLPSTSSDSEANNNTPSSSSTVTGRLFVISFMILCPWI